MAISLESALKMGEALPGVVRAESWGSPALKVDGKLMACVPTNKSAEPGSLMVRVDRGDREGLLAERPDLFYLKDHYAGYDGVLVRLAACDAAMMRDLLAMAHRFVTRKTGNRKTGNRKQATGNRKG